MRSREARLPVLSREFLRQNAYLLAWQLGPTYHLDTNISFKVAPVVLHYVGHGNQSAGFYGPFVGQGSTDSHSIQDTSTSSGSFQAPTADQPSPLQLQPDWNQ